MANILIIDDDKMLNDALARSIRRMGHEVECRLNLTEGISEAMTSPYDVIYLDVRMPDGDGLQAMPEFQKLPSAPEIIIITGYANSSGAELAIKSGAWDYVKKPSSIKEMTLPLLRALQFRENKNKSSQPIALRLDGIVGSSPQMKDAINMVAQAAGSDANVLITGKTGTGKELFASAVHNNSRRAAENFIVVDCTVLPETLVESLLFGHTKGAFTGANETQKGLVGQAHKGTLFLDEVGELPISVQKRFLRVLQERRFRPVGGKQIIQSDFRLIAATNQNLGEMVEKGLFRKDLYYRLRSFPIELPGLKERKEDIRELLIYYLDKFCKNYQIASKGFSPEFLDCLTSYDWPGNVRELVNVIENVLAKDHTAPCLFPYHLPNHIRIQAMKSTIDDGGVSPGEEHIQQQPPMPTPEPVSTDELPSLRDYREKAIAEIEKQYLKKLLTATHGNIKEACQISGISRSRLYGLLKKLDISKDGILKDIN
ncbi:MAG: sigma-54 dependent transcriptional regulator [Thermodesulfobacteriota bacterium]|nr:sigma-54 dependent transcriptional regulator [Thermodesulfobacteriota bacterium]